MIRAVLIDDETNNLENLRALLARVAPQVDVLATAANAAEGRKVIAQHTPDLLFLDIQMPGENGFELLQSLPTYRFEVIFVTAYDNYGIQAVKFAALDYLQKPVSPEELKTAVKKMEAKIQQQKQNLQLENFLQLLQAEKKEHRIALSTQKEVRFVAVDQIVYCEASNNYTTFFLSNGEKLVVSKPMYEYDSLLKPYGFVRCHQSYLANTKQIKSWVKTDGGFLLMTTGAQLPVSKAKKDVVAEALKIA